MWTYVLKYTCKYVQYTYIIQHRSYCIRTRRITYVHLRTCTYIDHMCTYMTSREPYVGLIGDVCECISNDYVQIQLGTPNVRIWTYMYVCVQKYMHIRAYTYCTYMYVFVIIRAYKCSTYMHVFLNKYVHILTNTCMYVLHIYARILIETSISRYDPASCYLHKPTSSTHAAV